MKKKYTPMTLTVEQFEPNEAVAGNCQYVLYGQSNCDDCSPQGLTHHWNVYGQKNEAGEWMSGSIGVSVENAPGNEYFNSSCTTHDGGGNPIKAGDIVIQNGGTLTGNFDPVDERFHVEYATGASVNDAGLIYNQNS